MDGKCPLSERVVDGAAFLIYLPCNQDIGKGLNNCDFHIGPVMQFDSGKPFYRVNTM